VLAEHRSGVRIPTPRKQLRGSVAIRFTPMVIQPNPDLFYHKLAILERPPTVAPRHEVSWLAKPAKIFKFFLLDARKLFLRRKKFCEIASPPFGGDGADTRKSQAGKNSLPL